MSLDVDGLDPSIISCTGTRATDGLSLEDLSDVMDVVRSNCNLRSVDIVEVNALINTDDLDENMEHLKEIV